MKRSETKHEQEEVARFEAWLAGEPAYTEAELGLPLGTVPLLDCPCCLTPTVPARWTIQEDAPDPKPGWFWFDDQRTTCPGCGCVVGVHVTDDYAEDRVAQARTVEECAP